MKKLKIKGNSYDVKVRRVAKNLVEMSCVSNKGQKSFALNDVRIRSLKFPYIAVPESVYTDGFGNALIESGMFSYVKRYQQFGAILKVENPDLLSAGYTA